MAGDTGDNVGNALRLFTQQVGVTDELVTENHQNASGSGTKWAQICRDKDILHMVMEPYIYWKNAAEGSWREILRLYKKKRIQKGVQKRLFPYLVNWCCNTLNATALDIPELDGKTPRAQMLGKTGDISHHLMYDLYAPVKYILNPAG